MLEQSSEGGLLGTDVGVGHSAPARSVCLLYPPRAVKPRLTGLGTEGSPSAPPTDLLLRLTVINSSRSTFLKSPDFRLTYLCPHHLVC